MRYDGKAEIMGKSFKTALLCAAIGLSPVAGHAQLNGMSTTEIKADANAPIIDLTVSETANTAPDIAKGA
jgi:hypothetical protein